MLFRSFYSIFIVEWMKKMGILIRNGQRYGLFEQLLLKLIVFNLLSTNMAETKVLQKPKFIKVADLETARSGYNVYVKILTTEKKEIDTRDGGKITMVECTIGD